MHIPKTAGTSFRTMLYRNFKNSEILPNQEDIRANGRAYPSYKAIESEYLDRYDQTKLFVGHYPYSAVDIFPGRSVFRMTFLRDPVKRAVSHIKHFQRHDPHLRGRSAMEIIHKTRPQLENLQCQYFHSYQQSLTPEEQLEMATENLHKTHFVGITEFFSESVSQLEKLTSWDLGKRNRDNVGKPDQNDEIEPEIIGILEEWNQLDMALFRNGIQLFKDRQKKHIIG